ncbi:MAG: adenine phosphoribosyltransferase [Prevotellaceae bacterium]|jgi:adenine phosphoribosyltransferase|nr:adenine phosphoribosyltransferase [Prevotellaceae bacterium]
MNRNTIIEELKKQGKSIGLSIAEISNYPEPGVSFKDITPVLQSPELFNRVNTALADLSKCFGKTDLVISPESRGFLFGPVIADRLGTGFIPARKSGKLPRAVIEESYGKEYGTDMIQIHTDAIEKGQRIIIIDDVLATGGTAKAIARMVERLGGIVAGYVFFIELCYLGGSNFLGNDKVLSLVEYN